MSDVLGATATIAVSLGMIALLWRYGLDGLWEILHDALTALFGATEALVYRLAHGPAEKPARGRLAGRCAHSGTPVPVEVHDTLDGRPEVVEFLCPDCREPTARDTASTADGRFYTRTGPDRAWRLTMPPQGRGGGSPALALRSEAALTREQVDDLKADIERQFAMNAARPGAMIVTGEITAATIQTAPEPLRTARNEVCARKGHEVEPIRAWGRGLPVRQICTRCAEPVGPDYVYC